MDRLEKQMQFILEVDKLKNIVRQNYLLDGSRREDDADHSWHLALMCVILSEYANEEIDLMKTMTMVLIHDIVEIDGGYIRLHTKEMIKRNENERPRIEFSICYPGIRQSDAISLG